MKTTIQFLAIICLLTSCATGPAPTQVPFTREVTFTGDYVNIGLTDTKPAPVFQGKPEYPRAFRAAGVEGRAVTSFIVERDGTTSQVQTTSATDVAFATSAIACVSKWKFKPGKKDGQIVRVHMEVPIFYVLNENH